MSQVRYGIDGVFRYASIGNFIQLLNIGAAGNWNLGSAAYGRSYIDIALNAAIGTGCDNSGAFDNRQINDAELSRHELARRQTGHRRLLEEDIDARQRYCSGRQRQHRCGKYSHCGHYFLQIGITK
jgi:hypothetical protein